MSTSTHLHVDEQSKLDDHKSDCSIQYSMRCQGKVLAEGTGTLHPHQFPTLFHYVWKEGN